MVFSVDEETRLVQCFNRKEQDAFVAVYKLYYKDLAYYASLLYANTEVDASDVVHDLFLKILERDTNSFTSLKHIKGYLYINIKSNFINYLQHKKYVDKFSEHVKINQKDDNIFDIDMIETETLSRIYREIDMLPAECAKVIRLSMQGWGIEDIAAELGKSKSTIYHQRETAISKLKSKIDGELLSIIFILLNF